MHESFISLNDLPVFTGLDQRGARELIRQFGIPIVTIAGVDGVPRQALDAALKAAVEKSLAAETRGDTRSV